jgi:hypothetical protein
MRILRIAFLFSPFFFSSLFAQTYYKKDLLIDLHYLDSAFRFGHPSKLAFPNDFDFRPKIKELNEKLPDELTKNQYSNAVRELLMEVKCLHTSYAGWKDNDSKPPLKEKFFPNFAFTDGKHVWINENVHDSLPTSLAFGDEIISINGHKMDNIVPILMNAHPDDGPGRQINKYIINNFFPQILSRCIPKDTIFSVVSKDPSGKENTTIIEGCAFKEKVEIDAESIHQGNQSYFSLLNNSLGYIRIKSIQKKENSFYEKAFQTIADSNIQTLILDLRNNPGGNLFSCVDFLGYILPDTSRFTFTYPKDNMRPFLSWKKRRKISRGNFMLRVFKAESKVKTAEGKVYTMLIKPKSNLHFDGKLYVLTSELTASGASVISSYARHQRESTLIGQTTGGGEYFLNAAIGRYPTLELPQSGILIQTATHQIRFDTPAQHFTGITPDILIQYDATTFGKRDLEMEKVLELIGQ